jgi:hypothetical protein
MGEAYRPPWLSLGLHKTSLLQALDVQIEYFVGDLEVLSEAGAMNLCARSVSNRIEDIQDAPPHFIYVGHAQES